ncbi:DUF1471 domain-containing protein [Enterobacter sp. EA-1]|nr:DUF1471 domain-containing protein [Enterobacter sp. EA-1]
MKFIKTFVAVAALSTLLFRLFCTKHQRQRFHLSAAEAKIAAQAEQANASYKITSARSDNGVYMTAVLSK